MKVENRKSGKSEKSEKGKVEKSGGKISGVEFKIEFESRIGKDFSVRIPKAIREIFKVREHDLMVWRLLESGNLEVEFYETRKVRKRKS